MEILLAVNPVGAGISIGIILFMSAFIGYLTYRIGKELITSAQALAICGRVPLWEDEKPTPILSGDNELI